MKGLQLKHIRCITWKGAAMMKHQRHDFNKLALFSERSRAHLCRLVGIAGVLEGHLECEGQALVALPDRRGADGQICLPWRVVPCSSMGPSAWALSASLHFLNDFGDAS